MPRLIDKLSPAAIRNAPKGMHADGGGLYLHVNDAGARSWIFRFTLHGRAREMGLGALHTVAIKDARSQATACRRMLLDGIDPIEARAAQRRQAMLAAARRTTFMQAAESYIETNKVNWSNAKHAEQWTSTLKTYAYPVIGEVEIGEVDTTLVRKVLDPIWTAKPETANRVRGRIESILDAASTAGQRDGANPARWKGHLENLLPNLAKTKAAKRAAAGKGKHQPAMPYAEIAAFMAELAARDAMSARGIEFTVLTAMRTETVLGGFAREIDFARRIWSIPEDRPGLKRRDPDATKTFTVPLSEAAIAVLEGAGVDPVRHPDRPLFPGEKPAKPLSNLLKYVQDDMARPQYTVHGFRSTFRTWADECTSFADAVKEMALAHAVTDKVVAAYGRGELLRKRRELMDAWARFCMAPLSAAGDVVVPIRSA